MENPISAERVVMMRVACSGHRQTAVLGVIKGEFIIAAESGSGVKNFQGVDR